MINEKEINQVEDEKNFDQQQGENQASKPHKISIRPTPDIQKLLDKSRRWREDPSQLWLGSSEIGRSEK